MKWHFFSGSVLKKQKTKCIDQYDQTSSIELLIFPNSIDDEKSFSVIFHFFFTNGKDVRYVIFYIWWVKIIWYDDLNMLLSRSLLLYRKSLQIFYFHIAMVVLIYLLFGLFTFSIHYKVIYFATKYKRAYQFQFFSSWIIFICEPIEKISFTNLLRRI